MSLIIRNYGLFWKWDNVYIGKGRSKGTLLGVRARETTGKPVDFRDQRGVYVLYAGYDLVYVGQTRGAGLLRRLVQHSRKDLAGRWDTFSWFGVRDVNKNRSLAKVNAKAHPTLGSALDHMEGTLILAAEPPLNRQGGRLDLRNKYRQYRDERLGPTSGEMIRETHERISALVNKSNTI